MVLKLRRRLLVRHNKYLSVGGRMVLLNYILSSMPIYLFSFCKAHQVVIKEIIILQKVFSWGEEEEKKNINWVS